jgi:transcription elongation factor GreA
MIFERGNMETNPSEQEVAEARTYLLTPEGFARKQERLNYLCTVKRREIAESLHDAKDGGNLHENSIYDYVKQEQFAIESEILELERLLGAAVVMTPDMYTEAPGNLTAQIGTQVLVENEEGRQRTFTLVESCEANPKAGFISDQSPVGKALLGCQSGDEVDVVTPGGTIHYLICRVTLFF